MARAMPPVVMAMVSVMPRVAMVHLVTVMPVSMVADAMMGTLSLCHSNQSNQQGKNQC